MDIEKLLEQGKRLRIKPRGYSMYPLIVPGRDEVFVERVSPESLRRGDVVLYRRRDEDILVLHRIWKREGDAFFLVGDNQKEIEGPLEASQIKGKNDRYPAKRARNFHVKCYLSFVFPHMAVASSMSSADFACDP